MTLFMINHFTSFLNIPITLKRVVLLERDNLQRQKCVYLLRRHQNWVSGRWFRGVFPGLLVLPGGHRHHNHPAGQESLVGWRRLLGAQAGLEGLSSGSRGRPVAAHVGLPRFCPADQVRLRHSGRPIEAQKPGSFQRL